MPISSSDYTYASAVIRNIDTMNTPVNNDPNTSHPHNYTQSIDNNSHPLFLHNNDQPDMVLISEKLTGSENYASWKRSLQIALCAKNKLVIVNGEYVAPDVTSPMYVHWKRVNDMVITWILNTVNDDISNSMNYMDSAYAVWNELCERFSAVSGHKLYETQRDLFRLEQGTDSVEFYFHKLKGFWDELKALEPPIKCSCGASKEWDSQIEKTRLIQFLMGLHSSYTAARDQLLMMTPWPTVNQAFMLLKQEEKQRQTHGSSASPISMMVNMSHSSNNAAPSSYIPNRFSDMASSSTPSTMQHRLHGLDTLSLIIREMDRNPPERLADLPKAERLVELKQIVMKYSKTAAEKERDRICELTRVNYPIEDQIVVYQLHPDHFFVDSFLVALQTDSSHDIVDTIPADASIDGVYKFKMMRRSFCRMLSHEIKRFDQWCTVNGCRTDPPSLYEHAVVLNFLGLRTIIDSLVKYLEPVVKAYFGCDAEIDSQSSFSVTFGIEDGKHKSIDPNYGDDSDVTIKLCLSDMDSRGAQLLLGERRCLVHETLQEEPVPKELEVEMVK